MPRLPGILGELLEAHGVAAALRLAEIYGGIRLYVPHAPIARDHDIVSRIGLPAANWLAESYGGECIKVPRAVQHLRSLRDAEIVERYANESAAKLAREYGMDERSVWRIVATGSRHERRTADLF